MSVVYLIRHGQASFGAADYDALSETGVRQSQILGRSLARVLTRPATVTCGDMLRHRQTARACMQAVDLTTEWRTDARWNEIDHERIVSAYRPEYKSHDDVRRELMQAADPHQAFQNMFEAAVARWVSGEHDADYVETWPAFRTRCREALEQLVARMPRGTDALVFTSGGPITAIVMDLLGIPDDGRFKSPVVNCGVTKLLVGRSGVTLSTFNNHAHFDGEHASLVTYR
jgi:broad specificity phosphatase PhoE